MKQTNVSGFRARLSEYLAAARNGETIIVHDRKTPIACLVPFDEDVDDLKIAEPSRTVRDLAKIKPVRLRRRVAAVRLLRESRDER